MTNTLVTKLKTLLADNYALYLKTQNYHWNVEGTNFKELHSMFEEQYTDLAKAIDTIAELIRGLGEKAPGTFNFYIEMTSIKPGNENASSQQMIKELLEDQILIQKTLQQCLEVSEKARDEVVIGFIIERLTFHRKTSWMLKSSL